MTKELREWLKNEIENAEKEIKNATNLKSELIKNCGENDIGVEECNKVIEYNRNRIDEINGFLA